MALGEVHAVASLAILGRLMATETKRGIVLRGLAVEMFGPVELFVVRRNRLERDAGVTCRAIGGGGLSQRRRVTSETFLHPRIIDLGERSRFIHLTVADRAVDRNVIGVIERGLGIIGTFGAARFFRRQRVMTEETRLIGGLIVHGGGMTGDAGRMFGGSDGPFLFTQVAGVAIVNVLGVLGVGELKNVIPFFVEVDGVSKRRATFDPPRKRDHENGQRDAGPSRLAVLRE